MKNPTPLVTPKEIEDYVYKLWRTDEFRESQRNGGMVAEIVKRFARQPRLFAEMSDERLETPHFASWWNVISKRDSYANPAIHDLYYLHEIIHAATMPYVPGISFDVFRQKMNDNELATSLMTEILIYFEMPGLRKKTFPHEIYADRFLSDPKMQEMWKNDREGLTGFLREQRREVMYGKRPEELDTVEAAIQLYAAQNTQWQMVWQPRYQTIENEMARFQELARTDRKAALDELMLWLQKPQPDHTNGSDVPFRREAEAFASIYHNNRLHYQQMVDSLMRRDLRQSRPPLSCTQG